MGAPARLLLPAAATAAWLWAGLRGEGFAAPPRAAARPEAPAPAAWAPLAGDARCRLCSAPDSLKAAALAAAAGGLVTCQFVEYKRKWQKKRDMTARWEKLNPKQALPFRKLKVRKMYVDVMRREDVWTNELFSFVDPRGPRFQFTREEYERNLPKPGEPNPARKREELGVPPEALNHKLLAMEEITLNRRGGAAAPKKEAEEPAAVKKGAKKGDDGIGLDDLDNDFMAMKGIVLSRKQMAARAMRGRK